MGRDRKSVAEHLANGTSRPSRQGPLPAEPTVTAEKLKRPASPDAPAAKVWKELTALLAGVVRRRDVPVLAELCRWIARSERISEESDKLSVTDPADKGLLINAGIATDKVALLSARFGISPADRAKRRAVPDTASAPSKPRVATRPRTKLDTQGQP